MKPIIQKYTLKNGTELEGQIIVPETLAELLKVYPEERVYILGVKEYMQKAKKRLISSRSPTVKFKLCDLTVEQQKILRQIGLLKVG